MDPTSDPDTAPITRLPPTRTGDHGETLAAEHLSALGLEVVARNWRISDGDLRGELDLVALDHDEGCVVVVEVKTRRGGGWGGPLAAIDGRKQARLRRLARAFVTRSELPYRRLRIDVIGVRLDTRHLHHVTHAL
ncbi:YraN family protein [Salsipaludibacter albus]|uniref:YraN family protein n=1 Tax=Salsipaludibacter albus TaxID=2849650 RepID=UPI001EE442EE|nr:YraN family protein [Salsipaludibacter albus]MBY5164077.1 YraN family protein [Salsipaludibacter albus]